MVGGETLTIVGTGFSSTNNDWTVTVQGKTCSSITATTTQITCTTGIMSTSIAKSNARGVILTSTVSGIAANVNNIIPWYTEEIDSSNSDIAKYKAGYCPDVDVEFARRLKLTSTVRCRNKFTVYGAFIFDDSSAYTLEISQMIVDGGLL